MTGMVHKIMLKGTTLYRITYVPDFASRVK